ncbi:hypothetical protein F4821DRAFT_278345 [Hypoxylon rubiginosum]|uniref:Uncharacterized protein n=1 Tax=Hypoxylon rubiginosum TaxID=110542 RepID=A0ACC0D2I8_9PEZI|nr:hypothetical protein F4821DRAFT_278345 [Hypoxylon rubiginosum]
MATPIPYRWHRPYPYNENGTQNGGFANRMPNPTDAQLDSLKGIFPQLCHTTKNFSLFTHVPLALNTFNCRSNHIRSRGVWVYVHDKLQDARCPPADGCLPSFPDGVREDFETPWTSVATNPDRRGLPRYRFAVWIFHNANLGGSVSDRRQLIFSFVFWDRETDEMHWHDTGLNMFEQERRWDQMREWWQAVTDTGLPNDTAPIEKFGPTIPVVGPNGERLPRIVWGSIGQRYRGTPHNQLSPLHFRVETLINRDILRSPRTITNSATKIFNTCMTAPTSTREPPAPRHIFPRASFQAIMSWIMFLGVYANPNEGPHPTTSPLLHEDGPRLSLLVTGLHPETMPTLIVLLNKILYHCRTRDQGLREAYTNIRTLRSTYGISDNTSLNRAVRSITWNDDSDLEQLPFDGLTVKMPIKIIRETH